MIIRRKQYNALGQCVDAAFEPRLSRFLREQFPETAGADEKQFRDEIRAQIDAARTYGLETEQQIATYVVSACALGADFDKRFPAAEQVLTSTLFSAEEKTRWLDSWTKALFESLEDED